MCLYPLSVYFYNTFLLQTETYCNLYVYMKAYIFHKSLMMPTEKQVKMKLILLSFHLLFSHDYLRVSGNAF